LEPSQARGHRPLFDTIVVHLLPLTLACAHRQLRRPPVAQVFEYFASVSKKDGAKFMVPADMMRACVPVFAPEGSDAVKSGGLGADSKKGKQKKSLKTSKFFQLFDTDGDGLIDFPEYIFFVRALPFPSLPLAPCSPPNLSPGELHVRACIVILLGWTGSGHVKCVTATDVHHPDRHFTQLA